MILTIEYSPELNIFTVHNGSTVRTITPQDIAGRLAPLASVFDAAKSAVVEGRAISGITVEV